MLNSSAQLIADLGDVYHFLWLPSTAASLFKKL
jgi:hypothetical protein